jgi:hypothetical protein
VSKRFWQRSNPDHISTGGLGQRALGGSIDQMGQVADAAGAIVERTLEQGSRWPAVGAVGAALLLQLRLPEKLSVGPFWLLPAIEALLLIALIITDPSMETPRSRHARKASLALIALLSTTNATSLLLLVHQLLKPKNGIIGRTLIYSAVSIWFTAVLAYSLWFWEIDRGGPAHRCLNHTHPPDFLFPQMTNPEVCVGRWSPRFLDYLYLSLTNSTAFSPTDALPLTARAKLLMATQSIGSLATVALVGARAVNILQ